MRLRFFSLVAVVAACTRPATTTTTSPSPADHDHAAMAPSATVTVYRDDDPSIAPGNAMAMGRLERSPRHGEWVTIRTSAQDGDSLRAWVVYPQRGTKAPVVIVVHEIFGLSTWVRSVADQLAADGFIAIAPDFLTGKINLGPTDTLGMQQGMALIRSLDPAVVQRQIDAAAGYGMALPAATQRYGIVGFCWGGGVSFAHAVHAPSLGAAVVYYGTSPASAELASVRAPVLGLYGENDARVDATIPPADSAMKALGRSFTYQIFQGAGHGFLRAQDVAANRAAAQRAWPMTVQFFRTNLER